MIRSVLFLIYMFLVSLVFGLIAMPALLKREWSIAFSKFWAGHLLGALQLLCGVHDKVIGTENIPEGPLLVAAKHESMWETLRLTVLLDRPSFVLKKELKHWPIFSWYCRANGFIFIDRDAGTKTLRDMTAQAKARMADGHQVVIFPEGTRSQPGEVLPLQPGVAALAKALGVPTVPMTHDSGKRWLQPGPKKEPGLITLKVFPPVPDASNRKAYMKALEQAIGEQQEVAA
ncbi:MAG: 1-acyl-sn-glycerol-3-phosphate acyltransferase [Parvularculaceae bacterium]|nr:1-acyl-sn-glycerol-3-phosphate acyltransferase [Parvularculaceae bacterium]